MTSFDDFKFDNPPPPLFHLSITASIALLRVQILKMKNRTKEKRTKNEWKKGNRIEENIKRKETPASCGPNYKFHSLTPPKNRGEMKQEIDLSLSAGRWATRWLRGAMTSDPATLWTCREQQMKNEQQIALFLWLVGKTSCMTFFVNWVLNNNKLEYLPNLLNRIVPKHFGDYHCRATETWH